MICGMQQVCRTVRLVRRGGTEETPHKGRPHFCQAVAWWPGGAGGGAGGANGPPAGLKKWGRHRAQGAH